MRSGNQRQAEHILETGTATVTTGGHWFHATRETVEEFVPGLLEKWSYESLIKDSVTWVESGDSIALLLFFALIFMTGTPVAAVATMLFYFFWFFSKSGFVNRFSTPFLRLLNHEVTQLGLAAVVLSILGIEGNYSGLVVGILYFFLFKVGILRLGLNWLDKRRKGDAITLNDRVLKMILIRYAMHEKLDTPEPGRLENRIRETMQNSNT